MQPHDMSCHTVRRNCAIKPRNNNSTHMIQSPVIAMNSIVGKCKSSFSEKTRFHTLRIIKFLGKVCFSMAISAALCLSAQSQGNEWTWVNAGNPNLVTATLGTFAPGNVPDGRYQATTWTDKNGNFWLFGGNDVQLLNSFWEYNPITNEWAWISGNQHEQSIGVYGTMGTASPENTPGSREGASSWTDSAGKLWLFGGHGLDASGTLGDLNDLWSFDPSTSKWTWMNGSSTIGNSCFAYDVGETVCAEPSVYGTLGTPDVGNTPGSREAAITWIDGKGSLWLFGGWSYDIPNQVQYYFNEVWKYDTSENQWAWMGGSNTRSGSNCLQNTNLYFSTCGEPGVYGTMGTPGSENLPGGRAGAASWVDSQGNLWLFSGSGFDANGYFGDPNDLWKFNPSSNQWTWMVGNDAISPCSDYDCSGPAVYGTLGTSAAGNIPLGRDHAVTWNDRNGNLWLFGGGGGEIPDNVNNGNGGKNDLWEFNPSINQWALMGGNVEPVCGMPCGSNPNIVYGKLGVPAPGDDPGARFASAGWTDNSGNFWLFGGKGSAIGVAFANDIWEFQPSTGPLPTTATPSLSVPSGTYTSPQSVNFSDATEGAFIYYTTDGSTPTVNSTWFLPNVSQLNIEHSATVQAIAVASGCLPSAILTATYTLPPQVATPIFSLPAGTYTSSQTLTISDASTGASIYYTTDTSVPTASSNLYVGPIALSSSAYIAAVAIADGYSNSDIARATYTLHLPNAANPTFSPPSGTYATPQMVQIADATPGAVIRYSFTQYPTASSPIYNGPIPVSSITTIWAIVTAPNSYQSSDVAAYYNIDPQAPATATPTFSLPAGTYAGTQKVTISDTSAGALIYYTTDGTTPTASSALYTGPISISSSETIEAVATASGDLGSGVASAAYTIDKLTPDFSIVSSATSLTVVPGESGTLTISVMPLNGFNSVVSFACSGLPAGTSCGFSPQTVTPSSASAATTVTVAESATAAMVRHGFSLLFPESIAMAGFLWCCLKKRRLPALFLMSCVAGLILTTGCGSKSPGSNSAPTQPITVPTPPITSTITVTATSGSQQHSTTFSLTIK
jgi:N-acetylneuraminic acid mutarotase